MQSCHQHCAWGEDSHIRGYLPWKVWLVWGNQSGSFSVWAMGAQCTFGWIGKGTHMRTMHMLRTQPSCYSLTAVMLWTPVQDLLFLQKISSWNRVQSANTPLLQVPESAPWLFTIPSSSSWEPSGRDYCSGPRALHWTSFPPTCQAQSQEQPCVHQEFQSPKWVDFLNRRLHFVFERALAIGLASTQLYSSWHWLHNFPWSCPTTGLFVQDHILHFANTSERNVDQ